MNMKKIIQPATAFFAGLIVICILIFFTAEQPLYAINIFFTKPFTSIWHFSSLLDKTSLLLFSAIGAAFAFKTGNFNLGGEGQIYFAGFLTAVLLKNQNSIPPFLYFIFVMLTVAVCTGFLGFISGILKAKFSIDELLTSFLISAAVIPAINYLITIPMRDVSGNLLATAPIAEVFILHKFFIPLGLNFSFVASVFSVFVFAFFFAKTKSGYRLSISGRAKEFSTFAGFSKNAPAIAGMSISAIMHSFSGFFAITGSYGLCHLNFSSGMGWSALVIALIARQNMKSLIPSAFLYAWIQTASDAGVMSGLIKFNASVFLQASIFLFITANFITEKHPYKKLHRSKNE